MAHDAALALDAELYADLSDLRTMTTAYDRPEDELVDVSLARGQAASIGSNRSCNAASAVFNPTALYSSAASIIDARHDLILLGQDRVRRQQGPKGAGFELDR
jgi:hypothetical protein